MSDDVKDDKKNVEEQHDLNTAYGRFMSEANNPKSPAYFLEGLLTQTDPRLKSLLMEDYKKILGVADVVNGLMSKIMSTPEGRREFQKEVQKFAARRQANELKKEDAGDNQEDT